MQAKCREIVAKVQTSPPIAMRDILQELKIEPSFSTVNKLRSCLTTNAFPYMQTVGRTA